MPVVFFLAAAAVLFTSSWGPLTVPGLVVAAAGILFFIRQQFLLGALTGLVAAGGSFAVQAFFGFCPNCSLAASLFAAAGFGILTSAAPEGRREKKIIAAAVIAVGLCAVILMFRVLPFSSTMAEKIPMGNSVMMVETTSVTEQQQNDKAFLYVSPWCEACKQTLVIFIETDPMGSSWIPVIVPDIVRLHMESKLRNSGYTGEVRGAAMSPSSGIPALVLPDGQILMGKRNALEWVRKTYDRRR